MLSWIQHRWTGLWLLVMALGALTLFMFGFFRLKYSSGKLAHMDDLPNSIGEISIDARSLYDSGGNSVILMVIDGLRYDFVAEEYMPYTTKLVKNKSACLYMSVAETPTVTMPRIKAMMTGTVPTFADVVLNFGASAIRGDSVLRVAAERGRRSVLYGDDTWLRLFPGLWTDSDGVTPFYLTDYTEVDNNVTRHLLPGGVLTLDDKMKPTFDFLVLHYLGLDHIGHTEGSRGPHIKLKLQEMDDIVRKLFETMLTWDLPGTLFVCGDHGMRDAGGHGGSTPAEVLVPLFMARNNDYQCPDLDGQSPRVAQVDLAPSVSWLLNAPPPADSTSRLLPGLLPSDVRKRLYLLHITARHNAMQCAVKSGNETEFYKQFKRAEKLFETYLITGQQSAAKLANNYYEDSLDMITEYFAQVFVGFDMFPVGVGIALLYCVTVSLTCVTIYSLQPENFRRRSLLRFSTASYGSIMRFTSVLVLTNCILIISCFITKTKTQFWSMRGIWLAIFFSASCAFAITYCIIKTSIEKIKDISLVKDLNAIDNLLIAGTILHPWCFFGTSYIEHEHITWYFFWAVLMFVVARTLVAEMYQVSSENEAMEAQIKLDLQQRLSSVDGGTIPTWALLIALHRYLRTINQKGDRGQCLPDTAAWLGKPENAVYLQAHLVIGTILTSAICLYNLRQTKSLTLLNSILTVAAATCILCYRIATDALDSPFTNIISWDTVNIVNIFWAILLAQLIFQILNFLRVFKKSINSTNANCNKRKVNFESYFNEPVIGKQPKNLEAIKLNFACSISHLIFNDLMLIIALLMKQRNVIMVPGIYITCVLTSKCMDHKYMDARSEGKTETVDILSRTLRHIWIGCVFFYYQGNSNNLASIDLASGYVGLREYCPVRVAMRVGIHAYAGPALAVASLYSQLAAEASSWNQYLQSVWRATNIFALQRVYVVFVYCIAAIFFRYHSQVWSVFSHKLVYEFLATTFTVKALVVIGEIVGFSHLTFRI